MNDRVQPGRAAAGGETAPGLSIGVLGPMEVRCRDVDRTPSAQMARRVLAVLLLHANQAVPVSAFVEELWEDMPPRLARKTIQTYMYQLRKGLEIDGAPERKLLETRPNGYLIRLEPAELDLWEFDRLVERSRAALGAGHAQTAAETLRAALALWRGTAFADVEPGPLLEARTAKLEDARLGALELRIEADLTLGRHRSLLGELRELTAKHPLNEEFSAQLMLAAHRAGRRGMALDAYARLRGRLVEELGIEPSERLQKLQHDVLTEAPSLELREAPAAAPAAPVRTAPPIPCAQLPPDTHDFTGRARELALIVGLHRARAATAGSGPRVVCVAGTPGTGKTTLAVHAAHVLRDHYPDGQLSAVLHDAQDVPMDASVVLWSLLRDVGVPPSQIPAGVEERARLFRSWSSRRALLILLDDAASADQLLPLLPASPRSLVLVTSRTRLAGLPGAATLALRPMGTFACVNLLASLAGAGRVEQEREAAEEIVRRCGNLPLGVRAAGEKLAARGMWSLRQFAERLADEDHRLAELRSGPFDVRARLDRAWARLPRQERQALLRLTRAGATCFDTEEAALVLGTDARTADTLVGNLLDAHMVETGGPGEGGGVRFRVPLLLRLALAPRAARPGDARAGLPDPLPAQWSRLSAELCPAVR